jgi:hypothetical protein
MSSGRKQGQRTVVILYPVNGIAEFQEHHSNQACYKSGVMSQDTHIRRHLVALKETAYPKL